jgi:hypothetical protein
MEAAFVLGRAKKAWLSSRSRYGKSCGIAALASRRYGQRGLQKRNHPLRKRKPRPFSAWIGMYDGRCHSAGRSPMKE